MYCQEKPPPRTMGEGLHGTYMPCLSTCLSHSEPWENTRPQNSHGKRFSVLIAAPRSENLIRSVRRKQKCYLCAGERAEEKSTSIRKPRLLPSVPKPFSETNFQIPYSFSYWLFTKGYFLKLSQELFLWFPSPRCPHFSSPPSCFHHK